MTNRHMVIDKKRQACIRVQHATFLNIGVVANRDAGVVAANTDIRPDAGLFFDDDITNDVS
mgnify:FL=1